MGLFRLLGLGKKEDGTIEMRAEAPKQEQKEKDVNQTGRERVKAIKDEGINLWNRFIQNDRSGATFLGRKAGEVFSMALGAIKKGGRMTVEGAFTVVGGIEKGTKTTIEGGKTAWKYAKETGREGMDIGQLVTEAAKNASTRTKEAAIDAGCTVAVLDIMGGEQGVAISRAMMKNGIPLKSAAGQRTVEGVAALVALGIAGAAAVEMFGSEQMDQAVATARQAKESGIDLAKQGGEMILLQLVTAVSAGIGVAIAIEERVGKAALKKGAEFYGAAKESIDALKSRAREAKNGFFARLTAARDRFSSRLKDVVLEALRPEIDQMIQKRAQELLADREVLSAEEEIELELGLDEVENWERVDGWDVVEGVA